MSSFLGESSPAASSKCKFLKFKGLGEFSPMLLKFLSAFTLSQPCKASSIVKHSTFCAGTEICTSYLVYRMNDLKTINYDKYLSYHSFFAEIWVHLIRLSVSWGFHKIRLCLSSWLRLMSSLALPEGRSHCKLPQNLIDCLPETSEHW